MTNGHNYEEASELKLFGSHSTYIIISTSDKTYTCMTNKSGLWNIPLIDSITHEYAMVVLSQSDRAEI
jgi:hypothetical protein